MNPDYHIYRPEGIETDLIVIKRRITPIINKDRIPNLDGFYWTAYQHKKMDMIFHMEGIDFITRKGIDQLKKIKDLYNKNQQHLSLSNISLPAWGVFLLTGFDAHFVVHDTLEESLIHYKQNSTDSSKKI